MARIFKIKSPVDGSVYAERTYHRNKAVRKALDKAQHAFESWKKTSVEERVQICEKALEYFQQHSSELAMEITMQMGRPIRYSPMEIKGGFMERANHMIEIAPRVLADISTSKKGGFRRFIKRESLGVVLILAPWNYPYLTSVNALFPAILAGNTVILKHAEQTALCAERYQEAFDYAGLPEGVFQFLHLDHEQVAEVIGNEKIAYVAFTGSVEGGMAIQKATGYRFIQAGLELGGKDPAYVSSDADLKVAIESLVDGAFFNSGQSCCGIERIYVHQDHFDDFVDEFAKLTKAYHLGDPTHPDTTLGPMVRKRNAKKVIRHIEQAVSNGAKKLIDSNDFPDVGIPYLPPQVLVNVTHEMEVMKEETFGPVVGIMAVKSDKEAIQLMNDSKYGLTASIWTMDQDKAIRIGNEVDTGTWFMNRCDYLDPELAWTGVKNSGKGCSLSSLGYDQLTRPKSFHLKLK